MNVGKIINFLILGLIFGVANFVFTQTMSAQDLTNGSVLGWPQTNIVSVSLAVTDINLSHNQVLPGETISGAFTIQNGSPFDIYGVHYTLYLGEQSRVYIPSFLAKTQIIQKSPYIPVIADYNTSNDSIDINAGGSAQKNFSYTFPRNLPAGDYYFWVTAQLERGPEFPSKEVQVQMLGTLKEPFTLSNPYFISADGKKVAINIPSPLSYTAPIQGNNPIGIAFDYNLKVPIKNTTLTPHIIIKKHSEVGPVVNESNGDTTAFASGAHSVNINIPNPGPGKYFALVYFPGAVKTSNGNSQAPNVPAGINLPKYLPFIARFYFDVSGTQAEIQNVFITKNNNALNVQGPILGLLNDGTNSLGDASVNLKTTDLLNGGETNQSQNINFPLSANSLPLLASFNLSSAPTYPKLTISISKNGTVLDEYSVISNGNPPPSAEIVSPAGLPPRTIMIAILGIIILIIILAIYMAFRKKNQSTIINP